jgi:hypothetical protein
MDKRQDGKYHPNTSRINRRIQLLEENVAGLNRELNRLGEIVGSKVDTNELFSLVGASVEVKDVTGDVTTGKLLKIGKWTISVEPTAIKYDNKANPPNIFFKGNLISVVPMVR